MSLITYPYYEVVLNVATYSFTRTWLFSFKSINDPALGFIDGRLTTFSCSHSMYGGARTRGTLDPAVGTMDLNNSDGGLDEFMTYPIEGQPITINYVSALDQKSVVFKGVAGQMSLTKERVTIELRELSSFPLKLSAVPVLYLGNNALPAGIEGTADDLKGQPKPRVYGDVFNVTPKLVNTSRLIYQVDGQAGGFRTGWTLVVRDIYVALTAGADYATLADVQATAPAAGQYRVYPPNGLFRLGSAPVGKITCDVSNPAYGYGIPAVYTTYSEIHAVLALMVETAFLNSEYPAIPGYYFNYEMTDNPYTVGIYIDTERTWRDCIGEVAASQGLAMPFDLDNPGYVFGSQMRYDPGLAPPTVETPYRPYVVVEMTFDEDMILDIQKITSPDAERGIPAWRVNVNYKRNYTVMQPSELGAVTAAELAFVTQEWRTVSASASYIKLDWFNSPEITVNTLLTTESGAQQEADRLLAIYKVRRDLFTITVPERFAITPGLSGFDKVYIPPSQYVLIKHSRFNLGHDDYLPDGRGFLVLDATSNPADQTVTLILWG